MKIRLTIAVIAAGVALSGAPAQAKRYIKLSPKMAQKRLKGDYVQVRTYSKSTKTARYRVYYKFKYSEFVRAAGSFPARDSRTIAVEVTASERYLTCKNGYRQVAILHKAKVFGRASSRSKSDLSVDITRTRTFWKSKITRRGKTGKVVATRKTTKRGITRVESYWFPAKEYDRVPQGSGKSIKLKMQLYKSKAGYSCRGNRGTITESHAAHLPGFDKDPPQPISRRPVKAASRTIYVVANALWSSLPAAVRSGAEKELGKLFAFVGSGRDAMKVRVLSMDELPTTFDSTNAVISLVADDAKGHVLNALQAQQMFARAALAKMGIKANPPSSMGRSWTSSEVLGNGGHNKQILPLNARGFPPAVGLPLTAGAVSLKAAVARWREYLLHVLGKSRSSAAKAAAKKVQSSKNVASWPAQTHALVAKDLAKIMAHEIRHQFVGSDHADTALGATPIGEPGDKNYDAFSSADKKAIRSAIKSWERKQKRAKMLETYPTSVKTAKDFPF